MKLQDYVSIVAPSVQVTSGAASALITIPNDASGQKAKAVRISAKGNVYILPQSHPFATGYVQFSATTLPANNDTVTINGTVITWKTSGATGNEINIQANNQLNAKALAEFCAASADANIDDARYVHNAVSDGLRVNITARVAGINTFTLAESSTATTVSGATLTGANTTAATASNSILVIPGEALCLWTASISSLTYIQETSAAVVNISPIEVG